MPDPSPGLWGLLDPRKEGLMSNPHSSCSRCLSPGVLKLVIYPIHRPGAVNLKLTHFNEKLVTGIYIHLSSLFCHWFNP